MDKKELIFPGIILGIVLIVAGGLILTHQNGSTGLPSGTASSTTGVGTSTASSSGSTSSTGTNPSSYYPYGTLTLSIGEVAGFKDGLSIRPTNVVEDSRCPAEVQCIQAGTVRISLKSSVKEVSSAHELKLGDSFTMNGDRITLTEVTPARSRSGAPAFSSYRLTFRVEPATTAGGGHMGTTPSGQCYIGGCSGEVCSDEPGRPSPCIYRAEFACYKKATCERQQDGACGWTQTDELKMCLANPPALL